MDPILFAFARAAERLVVAVCIPLLIYCGYRLIVLGATGQIKLTAETGTLKASAANLSPGTLCFVAALGLGAVLFNKPLEFEHSLLSQTVTDKSRNPPNQPVPILPKTPESTSHPSATTPKRSFSSRRTHTSQLSHVSQEIVSQPARNEQMLRASERFAYMGGSRGRSSSLSQEIRSILSSYVLCQTSGRSADVCDAQKDQKLNKMPTLADIEAIERLETSGTPEAQDELAMMRRNFLKPEKN